MTSADKIPFYQSSLGHDEQLTYSESTNFRFLKGQKDKKGTNVTYRKAKIYDRGEKWFVYYSFYHEGKFHRLRVYEDINRIKDPSEKKQYAKDLQAAINLFLEKGYNPFTHGKELTYQKNWTLYQSLNYFKQKIPDLGLRKKSEQSYNSFIKLFSDTFRDAPISEVNKSICQNAIHELKTKRKWGNSMYNNALTFGRLFFSWLNQNEICAHNPFREIKPMTGVKARNKPFSTKDFELIKKKADPELLRLLLFLYYSGTRPSEARQLTYENIDYNRKLLFIPSKVSKNKKDGFVPVPDQFLTMFKGEGLIFNYSKSYYTYKFAELKRKLKLPDGYNLYSIKATRAIHLAEDGASPYAIMSLFRHHSLEMTQIYLRDLGVNIGREASDKARNI